MIRSSVHRVIKMLAKKVVKNDLFEQEYERPIQAPIFQRSDIAFLSTVSQIEEAILGVRLVNHWATWCAPCVEELDILASIQSHIGPEHMLGISWDLFQGDSDHSVVQQTVHDFATSVGLKYPHHIITESPDAFFESFDLEEQIVPQTFVYSSTFDILFHRVGELKEEDIASIVEMIQSEDSQ